MSEDWSKLRDIDLLADGRATVDFAIPLGDFPRLTPQLVRTEGNAHGRVRFGRELGTAVADIEVTAQSQLRCQRCLAPMLWSVSSSGRVAMVAGGAEADRAPAGLETILAPEHRISIRELVEEELLLALPIVPLHPAAECAAAPPAEDHTVGAHEPHEERQRPFAGLDALLKRER
jgi:uncharacterized protein